MGTVHYDRSFYEQLLSPFQNDNMKTIIFATLLALATARPDKSPEIELLGLRNVEADAAGAFSFGFKLDNGVEVSKDGAADESGEAVNFQGGFKFISPEGLTHELTYVADENGYQPQSDDLPVAPAFPHPIPDFVLAQIEKAAREDAERDSDEESYFE